MQLAAYSPEYDLKFDSPIVHKLQRKLQSVDLLYYRFSPFFFTFCLHVLNKVIYIPLNIKKKSNQNNDRARVNCQQIYVKLNCHNLLIWTKGISFWFYWNIKFPQIKTKWIHLYSQTETLPRQTASSASSHSGVSTLSSLHLPMFMFFYNQEKIKAMWTPTGKTAGLKMLLAGQNLWFSHGTSFFVNFVSVTFSC